MVKGVLRRWNDEQGFGFIRTDANDNDVFIHVSALSDLSRRPVVGDTVIFNLESDDKGRKRAVNASIEGMKSVFSAREIEKPRLNHSHKPSRHKRPNSRHKPYTNDGGGRLSKLIGMGVLVSFLFFGYKVYSEKSTYTSVVSMADEDLERVEIPPRQMIVSQFKCEGKTRCSQMTSCEEAMFYLKNCPGTVTDGDGDGRPCEDQWCGH